MDDHRLLLQKADAKLSSVTPMMVGCRYFQLKFVHPPLPFMEPDTNYLVAQFPHAVYPMAGWLTFSHVGTRGSGMPPSLLSCVAPVLHADVSGQFGIPHGWLVGICYVHV